MFGVTLLHILIDVQTNSITTNFVFAWYQRVEYIKSNWLCRIDSLFSPTWTYLKIDIKFKYNSFSYGWWWDTPAVYWYTASNYCLMVKATANWKIEVWNWQKSIYWPTVVANTDYECEVTANNGTQTAIINWITYSWVCWNSLNTWSLQIFCWKYSSSNYWFYATDMTLYYMKIYSSAWTLAREFYPVYRKSDNVIWLFDKVNKVFYTNAWSGSFIKWPDL